MSKKPNPSAREISRLINAHARECLVALKPEYDVIDRGERLIEQYARNVEKSPRIGRTVIEMDSSEYERMRAHLGPLWEWSGLVRIVDGPVNKTPGGSRTS